ncbi:Protein arginine N-methyltransferase [Aphelenchoides besseyi]|nr:Protein arginine N-methyltransferase [Aphelenchoides besseyi]
MEENLREGSTNFAYCGFEDMLLDEDRNQKYRMAIESAVKLKIEQCGEAHVLDIGSGTGLLSLYAAASGATTVTAIELDPVVYEVSILIAKRAGLAQKIRFINIESIELDHIEPRANVLISEIFDSELLGENVLRTFRHALEVLTTNDVICVPQCANVWIVPIESEILKEHSQLPVPLKTECFANLYGVDGHWLTGKSVDVKLASESKLLKRFYFNSIESLELNEAKELDFIVNDDVDKVDGVLLWFELDLNGDGKSMISTGVTGARWRNHWLTVAYGFVHPIFTRSDATIRLDGSHDEVSFWFGVRFDAFFDVAQKPIEFKKRRECTCQWHSTLSSETICRWNNYNANWLDKINNIVFEKTVLCLGEYSFMGLNLTASASRLIVVEEDPRFRRQIAEHFQRLQIGSDLLCIGSMEKIECWDEIEVVVFDLLGQTTSSPFDFALPYMSARANCENARILPEKLEMKMVPVKFKELWRRKLKLKSIDGFDYTDFDQHFMQNLPATDDDLELLPLWEEQCTITGQPTRLFAFHNPKGQSIETKQTIPPNTDAFVFYVYSSDEDANNAVEQHNSELIWQKRNSCMGLLHKRFRIHRIRNQIGRYSIPRGERYLSRWSRENTPIDSGNSYQRHVRRSFTPVREVGSYQTVHDNRRAYSVDRFNYKRDPLSYVTTPYHANYNYYLENQPVRKYDVFHVRTWSYPIYKYIYGRDHHHDRPYSYTREYATKSLYTPPTMTAECRSATVGRGYSGYKYVGSAHSYDIAAKPWSISNYRSLRTSHVTSIYAFYKAYIQHSHSFCFFTDFFLFFVDPLVTGLGRVFEEFRAFGLINTEI